MRFQGSHAQGQSKISVLQNVVCVGAGLDPGMGTGTGTAATMSRGSAGPQLGAGRGCSRWLQPPGRGSALGRIHHPALRLRLWDSGSGQQLGCQITAPPHPQIWGDGDVVLLSPPPKRPICTGEEFKLHLNLPLVWLCTPAALPLLGAASAASSTLNVSFPPSFPFFFCCFFPPRENGTESDGFILHESLMI